jgi:hypothetical protein
MNFRAPKYALCFISFVVAVVVFADDSTASIERTAKRWYMLDLYGGTSMAHGEYDGIAGVPFTGPGDELLKVDASDLYKDGSHLGINYGVMKATTLFALGFRYTDIRIFEPILIPGYEPYRPFGFDDVNLTQWDFDLYLHQYFADLSKSTASPYLGLGTQIGATRLTAKGYKSENKMAFALSVDFGADLKITSGAGGRSFVTLSSVNSYQFVGTNDRPKYLNVGVGLKYFFRP